MADIVERLRNSNSAGDLCDEAAGEIEWLRQELSVSRQCEVSDEDERREQALIDEAAKYRTALVEIYDAFDDLAKSGLDHPAVDMARAIIARASKT